MLLYKISSLITTVAITLAFVGTAYSAASPAYALQLAEPGGSAVNDRVMQMPDSTPTQCPIDGFAIAEIASEENIRIDTELEATINLKNTSQYTLGGVRVGLAIYSTESQIIPDYWFVSEQKQLAAGEVAELPLQIDATALPAGEYVLRSFTMQGDAGAVLGAILRGDSDDTVSLTKSTQTGSQINIALTVNDTQTDGQTIEVADGEDIEVTAVVQNNNTLPLLSSSLVTVVSQGDIPLGAAVREMSSESVKLVPNGTRTVTLTDRFTETGKYSVYAGLVTENAFQPVVYAPLRVGDGVATDSWAYVSKVGVSTEALLPSSEIVGCFNYLGAQEESSSLFETLGLELEIADSETVVSSTEVRTDASGLKNFVSIKPGITLDTAVVTATLLQERFPTVIGPEGVELEDVTGETEIFLTPVQSVAFSLACAGSDNCGAGDIQPMLVSTGAGGAAGDNSFYFYAAIVIAAALLLYIMLMRLHPEENLFKENNSNELQ